MIARVLGVSGTESEGKMENRLERCCRRFYIQNVIGIKKEHPRFT